MLNSLCAINSLVVCDGINMYILNISLQATMIRYGTLRKLHLLLSVEDGKSFPYNHKTGLKNTHGLSVQSLTSVRIASILGLNQAQFFKLDQLHARIICNMFSLTKKKTVDRYIQALTKNFTTDSHLSPDNTNHLTGKHVTMYLSTIRPPVQMIAIFFRFAF